MCARVPSRFSPVCLFATLWTTASGSSVHGILQSRILEWVAMPSSRGIFWAQGSNPGLPHCRQILYLPNHQGSPSTHRHTKQVRTCPQAPELPSESGLRSALQWDYPNWPSSLQQTPSISALCCEDLSDLISVLCWVIQLCLIFATPWTVAHQAPLSIGFFQARIREPVAISFSKEPARPRDRTLISCVGRQIFLPLSHLRSPVLVSSVQFSSVQSLSRVQLFATLWIAARQASLSITNSWSSLRLTSIESVMPSSHLILGRPLLLLPPIPPSIRVFQWVNSSHEAAKVLEFQL